MKGRAGAPLRTAGARVASCVAALCLAFAAAAPAFADTAPDEQEPEPAPPPSAPPATVGTPIATTPPPSIAPAPSALAPAPSLSLTPLAPPLPPDPSTDPSGPAAANLRYALEGVEVRGNRTTRARIILRYIPFHAGAPLDALDPELVRIRFRLLATGFFQDVALSLRRGSKRGAVVLVVDVVERNTVVITDIGLGVSADTDAGGRARPFTAYGALGVAETNLAGTGITLGGAIAVADRQLALRARFSDPQFLGTPWIADAQVYYLRARDFFGGKDVMVAEAPMPYGADYAVVSYRRFGGLVGFGHDLGTSSQLFAHYRLETLEAELPAAASYVHGLDTEPIDFRIVSGSSILSSLRVTFLHDSRDQPFLATRGLYLASTADLALPPLGSDYGFVKLKASLSHYTLLPWNHVLRLDLFAGAVFGDAPFFERFYVGDLSDLLPDRVLELTVDRRSAPNFFSTSIAENRYGDYAARGSIEYSLPVYRGHRSIYGADVFASFGLFTLATAQDLKRSPRGYQGLAAIPIDFNLNAGLRVDTAAGGFTFGISNILGFLPVNGGGGVK